MKCQNLFSGKNKKNISVCCLLKILPRVLSVNGNRAIDRSAVQLECCCNAIQDEWKCVITKK